MHAVLLKLFNWIAFVSKKPLFVSLMETIPEYVGTGNYHMPLQSMNKSLIQQVMIWYATSHNGSFQLAGNIHLMKEVHLWLSTAHDKVSKYYCRHA